MLQSPELEIYQRENYIEIGCMVIGCLLLIYSVTSSELQGPYTFMWYNFVNDESGKDVNHFIAYVMIFRTWTFQILDKNI